MCKGLTFFLLMYHPDKGVIILFIGNTYQILSEVDLSVAAGKQTFSYWQPE